LDYHVGPARHERLIRIGSRVNAELLSSWHIAQREPAVPAGVGLDVEHPDRDDRIWGWRDRIRAARDSANYRTSRSRTALGSGGHTARRKYADCEHADCRGTP
jgi:hypothetical protein